MSVKLSHTGLRSLCLSFLSLNLTVCSPYGTSCIFFLLLFPLFLSSWWKLHRTTANTNLTQSTEACHIVESCSQNSSCGQYDSTDSSWVLSLCPHAEATSYHPPRHLYIHHSPAVHPLAPTFFWITVLHRAPCSSVSLHFFPTIFHPLHSFFPCSHMLLFKWVSSWCEYLQHSGPFSLNHIQLLFCNLQKEKVNFCVS